MEKAKTFVKTVKAAVDAEREIQKCPHCRLLLNQIKECAMNGHRYGETEYGFTER